MGTPSTRAAPVGIAIAPPAALSLESMFTEVQGRRCVRRRGFCRGRFGRGPGYRRCVRRAGCNLRPRRGGARRYCRRQNRICRNRWGGGPRYRRCMRRRGC
jgi:hypothetical protein